MIQEIFRNYSDEKIDHIIELKTSENSFNYKLVTENSSYVFRRLDSTKQGDTEFEISKRLHEEGICPEILKTLHGGKYYVYEGECFNLQKYIENELWELNNTNLYKLGDILAKFHAISKDANSLKWNDNKFDLREAINELKSKPYFNELTKKNPEFIKRVEEVKMYEQIETDIIHGDVTLNNIIYVESNFKLIDFGEARMGSKYFDLAGLLYSIFQKYSIQKEFAECYEQIIRGYSDHNGEIDIELLVSMIELWGIRGIMQYILCENVFLRDKEWISKMYGSHCILCEKLKKCII